jgi:hypothetical protein
MTRIGPQRRDAVAANDAGEPTAAAAEAAKLDSPGDIQVATHADDSYAIGGGELTLPSAGGEAVAAGLSVVEARSASRATGRAGLVRDLEALKQRLTVAIRPLPDIAEDAAQNALATSAGRILAALDRGDITMEEASRAEHMLSELVGGLIAIEQGNFTLERFDPGDEPGFASYDVHTTAGDTLRVTVRAEGSDRGQARLKLYNVVDGGERVSAAERIMVRFDLEGSELDGDQLRSAIDVQLGAERTDPDVLRMNKRIHGVLLDEHGQPLIFKTFVQEFLDKLVGQQGEDT